MFKFRIQFLALCCAGMAAGAAAVQAQTPPSPEGPPAARRPDASLGEKSPEQTLHGVVRSFLLTPAGDVDGLMLEDGTQVDVPPHLGAELSGAVRLRDRVEVIGTRAAGSPLVRAVSITDQATSKVVRVGATSIAIPPGKAAEPPALSQMTVEGRIAALLYTPRGDVGGVVMQDGTQVRFPPPEAAARGLAVGKPLYARGFGTQGSQGRAMEATAIGPDAAGAQAIFQPPAPRPGQGPASRGPKDGGPQARADVGPDSLHPPRPRDDRVAGAALGAAQPPHPVRRLEPREPNDPAAPNVAR